MPLEIKISVEIPDDLVDLRSREWFRSEFEEARKEHIEMIRDVLTVRRRRRAAKKTAQSAPGD